MVLALLGTADLAAQSCFRGRPLPRCRSWFITEGFAGAVAGRQRGDLYGIVLGGEVGWMRNLGPNSAVGGGVAVSNIGVSLRPRYRRWLAPMVALDVGPGVQWIPGRIERVEVNAQLMVGDRFGVWTSGLADFGTGTNLEFAAGLRSGGEAGLVTYAGGLVAFAMLVVAYSASAN